MWQKLQRQTKNAMMIGQFLKGVMWKRKWEKKYILTTEEQKSSYLPVLTGNDLKKRKLSNFVMNTNDPLTNL